MAEIAFPTYKISNSFLENIRQSYFTSFGLYPEDDRELSNSILRTSDFYIQNPEADSPWGEEYFRKAYLTYYLINNYFRCRAALDRLQPFDFWKGTEKLTDWGSGNGAFYWALKDSGFEFVNYEAVEIADQAREQFKALRPDDNISFSSKLEEKKINTLVCSYSLTELTDIPSFVFSADKAILLEPSTQQDGRRLMEWRQRLIERGFYVWAPCLHQDSCPLLKHSNKDWCHDTAQVEFPEFLDKALKDSPLRLNNPSFSYLALSKEVPPILSSAARVVGNTLKERGKTKQMVCRGEEREFLSWFNKREEVPYINRGALVKLPKELEKKSNELRKLSGLKIL